MNFVKDCQTLTPLAIFSVMSRLESATAFPCNFSYIDPSIELFLATIRASLVMFEATCLIKSFSVMKGDEPDVAVAPPPFPLIPPFLLYEAKAIFIYLFLKFYS